MLWIDRIWSDLVITTRFTAMLNNILRISQDGNGVFQHQPQQQPPPRQSSQLRTHTTPAFPGIAPPQSPGGFSSYSSQTPSPHYGGVTSPSDYERQREKEERRKIEEERRREQVNLIS